MFISTRKHNGPILINIDKICYIDIYNYTVYFEDRSVLLSEREFSKLTDYLMSGNNAVTL